MDIAILVRGRIEPPLIETMARAQIGLRSAFSGILSKFGRGTPDDYRPTVMFFMTLQAASS